ncbi:MAG TPA: hydroxyacid dehydrogenase [Hyphomicrobiaceae bacterium]|jgi:D-3-phosphoglycerate dehydrogenase|nr:hydroxyacid dehydrogenase [Hyphomicrobiaceae bacterium]
MAHKVICIQPLHPEGMKILHSRDDLEVIVPESPDPATWANFLPGAEAICVRLTKIPRAMMEQAPNLKIISRHGVGFDNIDVAAATERGVIVATVGLANAPSVVEHTIALMYALAKRLHEFDRAVREGDYQRKMKLDAQDVAGRTVLIIGLGRVGSRLAKALNALGLKCLGVDPAYTAAKIEAMGCEPVAAFRAVLPRADFVTVHCPLQDDTRNLIGAPELALMKPSAYLINCARGGIVDEAALLDALNGRRIMGAALDVQVHEPPEPGDPLIACDRLILTPHSAAATPETMMRSSMAVAQNVLDYFDGRVPVGHVVNPEVLRKGVRE